MGLHVQESSVQPWHTFCSLSQALQEAGQGDRWHSSLPSLCASLGGAGGGDGRDKGTCAALAHAPQLKPCAAGGRLDGIPVMCEQSGRRGNTSCLPIQLPTVPDCDCRRRTKASQLSWACNPSKGYRGLKLGGSGPQQLATPLSPLPACLPAALCKSTQK